MDKKKCIECKIPIKGRIDKKFCSDYCRNTYHNKVNKDQKNLIRNINNRLRKNFKILTELNPSGKAKISKSKLIDRGFYFKLYTSVYTTRLGSTYYYCYNQGYLALDNNFYLLIKKKETTL